jgi:hypothetical protein
MIDSNYLKLLHRASEANRHHGAETNRQAVVKEVKEEGGERKVRCIMGIKPDGSEWLSPWMSTQEQRSGQERSQSAIKPGQNGVIQGSFRQGTWSAQSESTKTAPQPKHAPQTNGPSSSVGKKFRSATHGGEDDQQQQGGGSQGSGGGSQGGGGGQKQEKEHYWTNYLVKDEEKLDKWTPQSGKASSTTTGHSGGGGQQKSSQQQQGKQEQKKEEKAMAVSMHEKMGHTAKIGDGDSAVRYAAHEKGAKIRAGKDNFIVAEKDKKNYCKAKIDNYVHAIDGQNYVNKPWVIKDCPKDPVPNHDEA